MIFKIEMLADDFLEKAFKEALEELNKFYEINWVHHLPQLIIVPDRKTINALKGKTTELWNTGWSDGRVNFILERSVYEKESGKKYSDKYYLAEVKHELSHSFCFVIHGRADHFPVWFSEGLAIYTSGQLVFHKSLKEFKNFLSFFNKGGAGVYAESGFVVELLIKHFGKEKILDLLKGTSAVKTEKDFENLFESIYKFKLSYEEFNKLLLN